MKVRRKPKLEDIEAITFDELIEYGRQNTANIVNGVPWSFYYKDTPVTHENDDCYIVGCEHFHRTHPPEDVVVETKIDDEDGVRNETTLVLWNRLFWFPDKSMYVYYVPTHWRPSTP